MESKSYDQIVAEAKSFMISNQSKITDFNKGSIIMTFIEAFARILEEGYEDTRLGYDQNLVAMAFSIFDFHKKEGTAATVEVVFTANKNVESDVIIPSGTKISDGIHVFICDQRCIIPKGSNISNSIVVRSESVGYENNIAANTINTIITTVPSVVVGVSNATMAVGGSDVETDADALIRFKKMLNGLQGTNKYGFESDILSIDGVKSVGILEHFPPLAEDNYRFNATIYVDDGSGELSDEIKANVEKVINGDGSNEFPGIKPPGLNYNVKAAEGVAINVSVTCVIDSSYDSEVIKNKVLLAIKEFIIKLGIGENVVLSQLLNTILSTGIKDVKNLKINGIDGNIVISQSQIATFNNAEIGVEYE